MAMEENEPFSSDDEIHSKKITLEHVIEQCGSFHRYQYFHFFFLTFFPIASGMYNFYYIFGVAEVPHQCEESVDHRLAFKTEMLPSKCSFLVKNYSNVIVEEISCQKWIYNRSIFGKTFTEEANLVCANALQRSFLATILQIGAMLIFFTGRLTDSVGRRRSMQLIVALLLFVSFLTQGLLQFFDLTINQKYVLMLINQFVSGIDTFLISFILLIELTSSRYATFVGNLASVAFALGEILLAGMAYYARHWLLLKWIMTLYMILLIPYLIFVPESPHWLLTKYRYDDLEKLLRQMARFNRRKSNEWLSSYRYVIDNHRKQKEINQKNKISLSFTAKLCRFLTHMPTMSRLCISSFLGFVTLLLYLKISYQLGAMDGIDPYLNIIIGAFVEAFGYIVASLFMISYGRKTILILFLLLTVICFVFTPWTFQYGSLILILVTQAGKFAISGAVCVTYIFVPELFPTSIRATGMGLFIFFSRVGSMIAPILDTLIQHDPFFSSNIYYLYAFLIILCILLTLLLPETRNVPLVDKIEYNSKNQSIT